MLYILVVNAFDAFSAGGATYLRFLGCYGLVFPLYVWVFMTTFGVRMSRPFEIRNWIASSITIGSMRPSEARTAAS